MNNFKMVCKCKLILFLMSVLFILSGYKIESKKSFNSILTFAWKNDTLQIDLKITNKTNMDYYIPYNSWDIDGCKDGNELRWFCVYPFFINQLVYFPSRYKEISYHDDLMYGFDKNDDLLKFILIKQKKSLTLRLKLFNFSNSIDENFSYRFIVKTPVIRVNTLDSIAKLFKTKTNQLIVDSSSLMINFFKNEKFKPTIGKNEFWENNLNKEFSKYKLSDVDIDSLNNNFRPNFIQTKGILRKTKK